MAGAVAQATNRRTLGAMVKELSKGGKLVWIAPSGGRDRPDPQSGDWLPHRYDPGRHRYSTPSVTLLIGYHTHLHNIHTSPCRSCSSSLLDCPLCMLSLT